MTANRWWPVGLVSPSSQSYLVSSSHWQPYHQMHKLRGQIRERYYWDGNKWVLLRVDILNWVDVWCTCNCITLTLSKYAWRAEFQFRLQSTVTMTLSSSWITFIWISSGVNSNTCSFMRPGLNLQQNRALPPSSARPCTGIPDGVSKLTYCQSQAVVQGSVGFNCSTYGRHVDGVELPRIFWSCGHQRKFLDK